MSNTKYLRCSKCGNGAFPRKAIIKDGKIVRTHETGTSTLMRCKDCAHQGDLAPNPYATMCRDCCPTGHGTR